MPGTRQDDERERSRVSAVGATRATPARRAATAAVAAPLARRKRRAAEPVEPAPATRRRRARKSPAEPGAEPLAVRITAPAAPEPLPAAAPGASNAPAANTAAAPVSFAFQVQEAESAPLWAAYFAAPDAERRNRLVELYQGLVRSVVRRFAARLPRSVDRGDLLTAGSVGLIAAIASFDPARGVRFEAYGERRIKGALLDELRTQDWMPRPWRHRIEQHKRVLERLRGELGRSPLDAEVAAALGIPRDEYQLLFGVGLPGTPAASSNSGDDGDELGDGGLDVVPDTRAGDPGERLTREELLALVAQRLTDQEYRIVYLKYWEELPMREIGQLTGISESRVCKIHMRLIERLKDRLRCQADG